jgi:hypothetical protein
MRVAGIGLGNTGTPLGLSVLAGLPGDETVAAIDIDAERRAATDPMECGAALDVPTRTALDHREGQGEPRHR